MEQLFKRKYIIQTLFILLMLILLGNVFYMQLITDKYFLNANNNALRRTYTYPARGVIVDRNNKILVQNQPTYDLLVTPNDVKAFDTLSFCRILNINMAEFDKKFRKAINYSPYQPSIFQKLLSVEMYATLQEQMYNFSGFFVQKRTIRYYPDSIAAQLLGYIREVNNNDIQKSVGYYKPGDYIGKSGIEKEYEKELRGQKGVTLKLYDAHNMPQGNYADGKKDLLAVAGSNLVATIDSRIQKLGEQLLANKIGSLIAIEPATGEILAFVSSPGYDPNKMLGKASKDNYPLLSANPYRPLISRPLQGKYSPGSAFKPLSALIALNDEVIDPNTTFYCPGYYWAGNRKFRCEHIDGNTNLRRGIARSCNTYFYNLFEKQITKNGLKNQKATYEKWQQKVRKFAIGDTLGIDLPYEKAYKLFRQKDYDRIHNKYWGYTTILSVGIGQGEITTTPLQMANIMAIIANRGYYIKPHVIKSIGNQHLINQKFKKKHYVGIDAKYFEPVIDGLQDAVNTPAGTAIESRLPNIIMCGKTGTVQNNRGKNHSVFIGFAPRDNPKIAIAVVVENGGYGGAYAAPIASFITEKYLTGSLSDRYINGASIQQYKDAYLLPNISDKLLKKNTLNSDSAKLKTDALNNKQKSINTKRKIGLPNKIANKPKKNAATNQ